MKKDSKLDKNNLLIEKIKQSKNLNTTEIKKIIKILEPKTDADDSMDFEIEGGRKLEGTVSVNTSKNGALGLLMASLLNEGRTVIKNVPRIEEINRVIELFKEVGISVKWLSKKDLQIEQTQKIQPQKISKEVASKIRSGLMMIGPILHYKKSFKMPYSGGCKMGQRTVSAHQYALEEFGVQIETKDENYHISWNNLKPAEIVMYEMSDTATINAILTAAKIPGKTTISFASANYQVQDVCFLLEKFGVKIVGIGTTRLEIFGKEKINEDVEHYVSEDPTEAMFWLATAVVTKSSLTIKRCPIDFLSLELLKLEKMGLKFSKSEKYKSKNGRTDLVDINTKPSILKALEDKIHAQPYPGINTDNLPFFATIATVATGTTLIHDWMWENRAIYFTELNRLGAKVDLADPHRVFITGPSNLHAAQVVCPPALRPATIILVAMLGTPGKSVLRNVYSIRRGYEDIANRLNSIGAKIQVIK